jgi:hypothetical protein
MKRSHGIILQHKTSHLLLLKKGSVLARKPVNKKYPAKSRAPVFDRVAANWFDDAVREPRRNKTDKPDSHPKSAGQKVFREQIDIRVMLWHVGKTGHLPLRLFLEVPAINDAGASV